MIFLCVPTVPVVLSVAITYIIYNIKYKHKIYTNDNIIWFNFLFLVVEKCNSENKDTGFLLF